MVYSVGKLQILNFLSLKLLDHVELKRSKREEGMKKRCWGSFSKWNVETAFGFDLTLKASRRNEVERVSKMQEKTHT